MVYNAPLAWTTTDECFIKDFGVEVCRIFRDDTFYNVSNYALDAFFQTVVETKSVQQSWWNIKLDKNLLKIDLAFKKAFRHNLWHALYLSGIAALQEDEQDCTYSFDEFHAIADYMCSIGITRVMQKYQGLVINATNSEWSFELDLAKYR